MLIALIRTVYNCFDNEMFDKINKMIQLILVC